MNIDGIVSVQKTSSTSYPFILFGDPWKILAADLTVYTLDDEIKKGFFVDIQKSSLISMFPLEEHSFVHLLVVQALSSGLLSAALSALNQLDRNLLYSTLILVGHLDSVQFDSYMKLIENFPDLIDQVLSEVILKFSDVINSEFYQKCLTKRWFITASKIASKIEKSNVVDLVVASSFDFKVVENIFASSPDCFHFSDTLNFSDPIFSKIYNTFIEALANALENNDFEKIHLWAPYFGNLIKWYFYQNPFNPNQSEIGKIISNLSQLPKLQLKNFSSFLQTSNLINLLFFVALVLQDYHICRRCIDQNPLILNLIRDTTIPKDLGIIQFYQTPSS